jgi:hypothetical protein
MTIVSVAAIQVGRPFPAGCGPAFVGTPEALAAHETTVQHRRES